MSNLSVRSQANRLAGDLDSVAKTLSRALQELAPLESSMALLESMLGDAGSPLASALEMLKEVEALRDQVDDAAQARAKSLLDDAIRIVSSVKDRLVSAERCHQAALNEASRLSDVIGSGGSGCAEAVGQAAGKASALYETAKSCHATLKNAMGPKHESVTLAGKVRKRTKTAEKAVEQACGSVATACDKISEFKGAIDALEIPPSEPLETALSQLQTFDPTSSDQLPDTGELEQLAARARKSHNDVSNMPALKSLDASISSAKGAADKASGALGAV